MRRGFVCGLLVGADGPAIVLFFYHLNASFLPFNARYARPDLNIAMP
jgi:hypothetical protein